MKELFPKKPNWSGYQKYFDNCYINFLKPEYSLLPTEEKYNYFVNKIVEGVISNTPNRGYTRRNPHRNPVAWWDEECSKQLRLRKAIFKKWRFTLLDEDRIKYNKAVAVSRKLFKKKKLENFRNFLTTINFKTSTSYVWNKIKIFKNKWAQVDNVYNTNGTLRNEMLNTIDKICPPWVPTNPNKNYGYKNNHFLDCAFNFAEFNYTIENCKPNSAPGLIKMRSALNIV